jgi:GT2 family glycosyltransferase
LASVSIVIPTNRPAAQLRPCLNAIAGLRFDASHVDVDVDVDVEVVVVFNGVAQVDTLVPEDWPFRLITDSLAECNICAAKNRAFDQASGQWIILINDDTYVEPGFVAAHLAAHRGLNRPGMVLGRSVWKTYEDQTVFDRMIAATSMIFFYDRLTPHRWHNFRHAWNLNLSFHRRYTEDVRFDERLKPVNFDDVEWAYRMEELYGLKVWYAPEAVSQHDHRYTLDGYLHREFHLGRMAALLWRCNADCFRAIYGTDLDAAYLEYCRRYVEIEGRSEAELRSRFDGMVSRSMTAWVPPGASREEALALLYDVHVPLKRLAFRRGLLSAVREARPVVRLERVLAGT